MKVNVHRVYDLIRAGLLPALKTGSIKIRKESLEEFLKKHDGMDLTDLNNICSIVGDNRPHHASDFIMRNPVGLFHGSLKTKK